MESTLGQGKGTRCQRARRSERISQELIAEWIWFKVSVKPEI